MKGLQGYETDLNRIKNIVEQKKMKYVRPYDNFQNVPSELFFSIFCPYCGFGSYFGKQLWWNDLKSHQSAEKAGPWNGRS